MEAVAVAAVLLAAVWAAWRRVGKRRAARRGGGPGRADAEPGGRSARRGGADDPGAWAWYYRRRPWLLTRREKAFEARLRAALDDAGLGDWRIAVQVALSALVDRRPERADRQGIPGWRLDYVVADGQWSVQGAIELNDASHARERRGWRDARVAEGLRRLEIPLLVLDDAGGAGLEAWLAELARGRAERLGRGRRTGRPARRGNASRR